MLNKGDCPAHVIDASVTDRRVSQIGGCHRSEGVTDRRVSQIGGWSSAYSFASEWLKQLLGSESIDSADIYSGLYCFLLISSL
jgi:hypothetical protein